MIPASAPIDILTSTPTPLPGLSAAVRGARAVDRCDLLGTGRFSDQPGLLFRAYLSSAHRAALDALAGWMSEAGMTVRLDPAGNLIGRYAAVTDGVAGEPAPALIIGSHIDSVRDAGRYDGPLGVMLGIESVARLFEAKRRLSYAIEVIAFGDEEGSRFHTSMLCSRAVAGVLGDQSLDVHDAAGRSLAEALQAFPALGSGPELSLDTFADARRDPASILAFFEAHIEQGPVLEAEGLALGIVTGIAGQLRYRATVTGKAGHAGTTSMGLRRDALAAAAEIVLMIEQVAAQDGGDVVATVGRMIVTPGAVNVVPGHVEFSIDIRSGTAGRRDAAATRIIATIDTIAASRNVATTIELVQDLPTTPCDASLVDLLAQAVVANGAPERRMVSGAGHDTMVMAKIVPTAMLFIRCAGGISHHPAESVDRADVALAVAAIDGFLDLLEVRNRP